MGQEIVDRFIRAYAREHAFYRNAAEVCSEICEGVLRHNAIRAMVTHRAKSPSKVAAKVRDRNSRKNYQSEDEIRADIVDLAGVRIALYFPGDRDRVADLLRMAFEVREIRQFPGEKPRRTTNKFSGYHADHYRLTVMVGDHDDSAADEAAVEVQVGSVLMHAWAEVEHDLVYKPESGDLSEDELAILDEVNGLVLAGEIALQRLQVAAGRRLSDNGDRRFDNHYDLGSFIYKWASDQKPNAVFLPANLETLFDLLVIADMARPNDLRPYLSVDLISNRDPMALATKAIQGILADHRELTSDFLERVWLPRFAPEANMDLLTGLLNTLTVLDRFCEWWANAYEDPSTMQWTILDLLFAPLSDDAKKALQYLVAVRDAARRGADLIGAPMMNSVNLKGPRFRGLIDELKAIGPEAAAKLVEIDVSVPGPKLVEV